MRIKFLSVIASFLLISIVISSCLDSEENYEISANATVQAFGIDTIHGKYYKFSVDNLKRLIYNVDSLPVGSDTIIDSIMIDTFYVSGYVTSGELTDTVLNINNYQDLSGAATEEGLQFKVHAADGVTIREYTLKINIHQQDPDSLQWENVTERMNGFHTLPLAAYPKSVVLDGNLLVYVQDESGKVLVYRTPADGVHPWTSSDAEGLPGTVRLDAMVNCGGVLYAATTDKEVYRSADGAEWTKADALSGEVEMLVADYSGTLIGVLEKADGKYLVSANAGNSAWNENGVGLPEGFPSRNIATARFQTASFLPEIMIVGYTAEEKIIPWAYDGNDWAAMDNGTSYDTYCLTSRIGHTPIIMHYGGRFYMFGELLDAIYTSSEGLAWSKVESKFLLPQSIAGNCYYTAAIDEQNFIWLITGGTDDRPNEIWRGRLNRLGFIRQ